MSEYQIRYGVDLCPATKNFSQAFHCSHCDFKKKQRQDCCECRYIRLRQTVGKEKEPPYKVH